MQLNQAHTMQQPDVWLPVPTFESGSRGAKKRPSARLCKHGKSSVPGGQVRPVHEVHAERLCAAKKVIGSAPDLATKQRLSAACFD
jgi:hypothetical protein